MATGLKQSALNCAFSFIGGIMSVMLFAQNEPVIPFSYSKQQPETLITDSIDKKNNWTDNWHISADLLNRWNWRGLNNVTGAVIQPDIGYSFGNFSIGAWTNYSLADNRATEFDSYLWYESPLGFNIEINDFFTPNELAEDGNFLNPDFHILEVGARQQFGNLSLGGWYWFNYNDDIYFEAVWEMNYNIRIVMGGGRGYYTDPLNFNNKWSLCNIGLWLEKEIHITDTYSQPVVGRVVYNPEADQITMVFGFNFTND